MIPVTDTKICPTCKKAWNMTRAKRSRMKIQGVLKDRCKHCGSAFYYLLPEREEEKDDDYDY